jgi:hypothetical protein
MAVYYTVTDRIHHACIPSVQQVLEGRRGTHTVDRDLLCGGERAVMSIARTHRRKARHAPRGTIPRSRLRRAIQTRSDRARTTTLRPRPLETRSHDDAVSHAPARPRRATQTAPARNPLARRNYPTLRDAPPPIHSPGTTAPTAVEQAANDEPHRARTRTRPQPPRFTSYSPRAPARGRVSDARRVPFQPIPPIHYFRR